MKTKKLASLIFCGALAGASACQKADADGADEYRNALPGQQAVTVEVPVSKGRAQTVEQGSQALLGETSEFYKLTRGVSEIVNGGVVWVLTLVREVVRHPPTSLGDNVAVWGPWSGGLEPNAWKVTVTRVDAATYSYKFEGKPKAAPDSAFVTVLSGTHKPTIGPDGHPVEGFGNGTFVLDFDASKMIPDPAKPSDDVGKASITYSRPALGMPVSITATFDSVRDDDSEDYPGQLIDVNYSYSSNPGGSGTLEFLFAPVIAERGRFAVKSRWLASGAGRSDVNARGGEDLPPGETVTANECWNDGFASVYLSASWAPAEGWGDAASCAFADASYATLQLQP
jgi:hypothetical protein